MRVPAVEAAGEAELVRAAASGGRSAWRALFDRHHRGVLGYCLLACGRDRERALDLTQETFLRALRGLPQLAEPERFRGWLFSIAANLCRGLSREARRQEILALAELDLEAAPQAGEAERREARIAAVRRLLAGIADPELRQVVTLKYGEPEHTTREIAVRLGIPHGTVTSRLVRFRAAVRRDLIRALLEEEP
jgi:RNA polymerase sigma-70 factor (ECF subfamily)